MIHFLSVTIVRRGRRMSRGLTTNMFQSALETLNLAIWKNRQAPYFQHLLDACEAIDRDERLIVSVYFDDPADPHLFFTVRINEGRLELIAVEERPFDVDWNVSEDYLFDLATHPEKFVEQPSKLSLNWLVHRVSRPERERSNPQ